MKSKLALVFLGGVLALYLLPFFVFFVQPGLLPSVTKALSDWRVIKAAGTSLLAGFLCLLVVFTAGTPAAAALARRDCPARGFFLGFLMLPLLVPSFITSMGIHFVFIRLGLAETLLGVVLVHAVAALPYYVRAMMAGFQTLSPDYEALGQLLGAGALRRFWEILLPQLIPALLAGSGLVLAVSFSQYLNTLIIGGGRIETIAILIFPHMAGGSLRTGMAYSLIFTAFNLLLYMSAAPLVRALSPKKEAADDSSGKPV